MKVAPLALLLVVACGGSSDRTRVESPRSDRTQVPYEPFDRTKACPYGGGRLMSEPPRAEYVPARCVWCAEQGDRVVSKLVATTGELYLSLYQHSCHRGCDDDGDCAGSRCLRDEQGAYCEEPGRDALIEPM